MASDVSSGLTDDSCAFLRLSVALKSELHYQTLLAAKILQLRVEFQHKLGYQVGKTYSRVGTEDWVPGTLTSSEFRKRVNLIVEEALKIQILEKRKYDRIIQRASSRGSIDDNESAALLNQFSKEIEDERKRNRESIFSEIGEVLANLSLDPADIKRARSSLESNPQFASLLRKAFD